MNGHQRRGAELARAISAHHRECGKTKHVEITPRGAFLTVYGYCGHAAERALFAALAAEQAQGWPA